MLPALVTLKNLIKTKAYHTDLPFFRLHYQATVSLLLAFCLILTAKVLFGDTIDCLRGEKQRDDFWDNACYSTGTYTRYMVDSLGQANWNDNSVANVTFKADKDSRYMYTGIMIGHAEKEKLRVFWHTYYQYMPVILFIQALLFYLPHYIWKLWENGTISSICKRLHENRFTPNEYFDANYDIVYYLQSCFKLNKSLVYQYYFCHVLCLLNLVLQIIALNIIFNYQFLSYGYLAVKYLFFDFDIYGLTPANNEFETSYRHSLNSPMDLVFPKITNCHLEIAQPVGLKPMVLEFMCILPLNILHDKFFLLLWFWFLILVILTVMQIIYDLMFTLLPFFRNEVFRRRYGSKAWDSEGARSSSLAEIFLLDIIGHNSDKFAFTALLKKLHKDDWTASPSENHSIV